MRECAYEKCDLPARERSIYCSERCLQNASRDRNREKFNKRMREYARKRAQAKKAEQASMTMTETPRPNEPWQIRRQRIIEKYGATRQWMRKQEAR